MNGLLWVVGYLLLLCLQSLLFKLGSCCLALFLCQYCLRESTATRLQMLQVCTLAITQRANSGRQMCH